MASEKGLLELPGCRELCGCAARESYRPEPSEGVPCRGRSVSALPGCWRAWRARRARSGTEPVPRRGAEWVPCGHAELCPPAQASPAHCTPPPTASALLWGLSCSLPTYSDFQTLFSQAPIISAFPSLSWCLNFF